jgi:hypothetical protein
MSAALPALHRALAGIWVLTAASINSGSTARTDEVPAYCAELKQVAALVLAKDKFASIIGRPREGNFLEAKVTLPGWDDCSFYGTRTYTCNSHGFKTADEGEQAHAKILGEVKSCLRDGWSEDESRRRLDTWCCTTKNKWPRLPSTPTKPTRANISCVLSCFCEVGSKACCGRPSR